MKKWTIVFTLASVAIVVALSACAQATTTPPPEPVTVTSFAEIPSGTWARNPVSVPWEPVSGTGTVMFSSSFTTYDVIVVDGTSSAGTGKMSNFNAVVQAYVSTYSNAYTADYIWGILKNTLPAPSVQGSTVVVSSGSPYTITATVAADSSVFTGKTVVVLGNKLTFTNDNDQSVIEYTKQ
ncbi:MAG TPA: hypothetical protein PKO22_07060 [Treponemataceae bacterium]|nr:hypothetical protein [Treponemataceae bacterium]